MARELMRRLAGFAGVPPSEAARRTREMLASVGDPGPDTAQEGGVTVTLAGTLFQPAGGAAALLRLYRSRGLDGALRELIGDFAFAIADENAATLHLARDRFGVRPLFYCSGDGKLAFASRLRSLLALREVSRSLNKKFVGLFAGSHYRMIDNDPDRSPFAAIRQLPAAHCLTWKNGAISLRRYWSLDAEQDLQTGEQEIAGQYRELLLDAVRIRLAAAPEAAFTLSGGMDSSSVLACAVRVCGGRQHAFSTVYSDPTYDESEDIKTILDATVQKWHPVQVDDPDVHSLVTEMVAAHDEPVATATWLSHYMMCREVKRAGFGALFGGLGSDELNAGEYEHFLPFFADLRARGLDSRLDEEVRFWVRYHDHPIFRKSRESMERDLARLTDPSVPGRCLPDQGRLERYADTIDPAYFDVRSFQPVMEHPFSSYLKNRTWQDLSRETVPCCLRGEDRQCAAFGLTNVLPFLDHRLVEFMFRVPPVLKYRDGVTKHMLREAMKGVLPEPTRRRVKKTGWNAPAHQWFFSGRGRETLRDLVGSRRFRERGIYRVTEVERLLAEHEEIVSGALPRDNHMMFFWQLVNLNAWLDWVDALAAA
jgi:asparagine synthase (glutamine-hydrolysing)